MKETRFEIGHIPAAVYGPTSDNVWLFVHGKCGRKEEGQTFAEIVCPNGWQVLSIDLPGHGERTDAEDFTPWHAVPELQSVLDYAGKHWRRIALRANSIGAWFSMLAFQDASLERALFVSPVLDMEALIRRMMGWANVTEAELKGRKTIPTDFGETLSWDYWQYAQTHPVSRWECPTAILYAGGDNLTELETVESFTARFGCDLTVYEEGEHWFHTPEQLRVLSDWEQRQATIPIEVWQL